jgi:hypothetical protein
MKYMFPALSHWMPSWDVRGITFWCTNSAPALAASDGAPMMPGASMGFLNSNRRPYGLVEQPAAAVHQLSSAVTNVPQGVQ